MLYNQILSPQCSEHEKFSVVLETLSAKQLKGDVAEELSNHGNVVHRGIDRG